MNFIFIGSILAAVAVALGAFGAHALEARLGDDNLRRWETAVRYQLFHSIGLIAVGLVEQAGTASIHGWLELSGGLMQGGIVFFSGSLYALALSGRRWLGAVAPLGGLLLIAAWLVMAGALWRL